MYYFPKHFLYVLFTLQIKAGVKRNRNSPYKVAVWFENQAGLLCHQTFPVLDAQVCVISSNLGQQSLCLPDAREDNIREHHF